MSMNDDDNQRIFRGVIERDLRGWAEINAELARAKPYPTGPGHTLSGDDQGVGGIPDSDLLERAVRSARANKGRGYHPRWTGVADVFQLGSTYSRQLCRRFGLDPDEKVRR